MPSLLVNTDSISLIVSLFSAVISVVGATATISFKWQQMREAKEREEISADVDIESNLITSKSIDGHSFSYVLETQIKIRNNCSRTICIPATYVTARALIIDNESVQHDISADYEGLPKCGILSKIVNVARFPKSVYQLAPNETEQFVRWDMLNDDFIKNNPIIVIKVEVFATPVNEIGMPKEKTPKMRKLWLQFMSENGHEREKYALFDRVPFNQSLLDLPGSDPGDWYLCEPNGSPDKVNTLRFKPVLKSLVHWFRHKTVILCLDQHRL